MDAYAQSRRIRDHFWHRLESESGGLEKVLTDVQALAAAGSFVTARKRFGHFRLVQERRLRTVRRLEPVLDGSPGTRVLLARVQRERARVLEQSDRVWRELCHERSAQVPRMLARLAASSARHEQTLRRLVLAEAPLSPAQLGMPEPPGWHSGNEQGGSAGPEDHRGVEPVHPVPVGRGRQGEPVA